jgi:U3 small nucleolar RNA-associated protein MPP10
VYEAEYVKAATGFSAPDKQDAIRQQASALFKALCAKLDALSSFTYTPKPVVTELKVRHWLSQCIGLLCWKLACVWEGCLV